MTLSKNGVGLATVLVLVLGYSGIEIELQTVVDFLAAFALIFSTLMTIKNQLERPDTKWFFFKK